MPASYLEPIQLPAETRTDQDHLYVILALRGAQSRTDASWEFPQVTAWPYLSPSLPAVHSPAGILTSHGYSVTIVMVIKYEPM
jgi:hypothetical protein